MIPFHYLLIRLEKPLNELPVDPVEVVPRMLFHFLLFFYGAKQSSSNRDTRNSSWNDLLMENAGLSRSQVTPTARGATEDRPAGA